MKSPLSLRVLVCVISHGPPWPYALAHHSDSTQTKYCQMIKLYAGITGYQEITSMHTSKL